MQNKKVRLFIFITSCFYCLLLAALLSACGGSGTQASSNKPTATPTPTPTPIPTKTYKGKTFSFAYNSDWQLNTIANNTVALISAKHPNEAFSIAEVPTAGQQAQLDKGIDGALTITKANGTDYKEDPSVPATTRLGGASWHQKSATLVDNKTKATDEVTVLAIQRGDTAYLLEYVVEKAQDGSNSKQDIQPILDSFKFLS